ncbi:hypothetical protein Bca4012_058291 [Brassica carinata]
MDKLGDKNRTQLQRIDKRQNSDVITDGQVSDKNRGHLGRISLTKKFALSFKKDRQATKLGRHHKRTGEQQKSRSPWMDKLGDKNHTQLQMIDKREKFARRQRRKGRTTKFTGYPRQAIHEEPATASRND